VALLPDHAVRQHRIGCFPSGINTDVGELRALITRRRLFVIAEWAIFPENQTGSLD
jgi:hypothetical protein